MNFLQVFSKPDVRKMIPFIDLKLQYQSIKTEILSAIENVLESSQYVLGPEVASLEEEFAAYCGVQFGVAVNSGTSALHLALLAAGVKPGDEVVTVSHTFVATVAAILYAGAIPVLVDIDPQTQTMDSQKAKNAISARTKAILPVHLHGLTADMDPLREIAEQHGLALIEDAAQAHGAEYHGNRAGSLADMACFSFYPGKNLGAYGEGGMVMTNDLETANKLRLLRDWGAPQKYHHELLGFNYRMEGIQGAILRVKLRHLENWTEARRRNARIYNGGFQNLSEITLPEEPADFRHVYHVYAVRVQNRDRVQENLLKHGIQSGIHYPVPVHKQRAYTGLVKVPDSLHHTEMSALSLLSLPMYAELHGEQILQIVSAVQSIIKS